MANTDKDILITPNRGSSNEPKIEFKGASSTVGPSTITATIYPTNNGTLSFDGTEGSLFSIANNLTTGSIFSVNPISGIPIIDVNADRTIALNPYGGNTGIGLTNPSYKLDVSGIIRGTQLISSVATGTSPLTVSSTTKVTNLNVDYLDDQSGSYYRQAWQDVDSGTRTNYTLGFQPLANNYAGFYFSKSTSAATASDAGYLLVRGTSDNDVYTAEGITLVADAGWLTLAQRTTASRGVRIMSGTTTSTERIKVTTDGAIEFVNGTGFTYNSNTIWHAGNDGDGSELDADKLDGEHGSYYLNTSNTGQSKSGPLSIGGATSRSTSGLTVGFTNNTTFAANTNIGDGLRTLSLINESSTTNVMAALGFRVNPNGGNANAMLDMKFVQTGATNTSSLYYTFNHGGSFSDRFLFKSDGTFGVGSVIKEVPYDTLNNGTLSWEGSAGQLFSITNNLTSGSIFSVNDVSGLPSIDVDANGTILLAPYGGNIGAGTLTPTQKLHVVGNSIITGSLGLGIDSAAAKLHTRVSTPTSIGSLPSGVTGILDSSSNNYLLFRNSADNGTYSGIAMQDNNVGGYVIFGNAGGGGDLLYVAGYGGGQLQYGTADSINPSARTTVASWNSTGLQINNGDLRAPIYRDSDDPSNRYLDPSGTTSINALNAYAKAHYFGTSANWEEVGFDKQTNVHFQNHQNFWIGAGNGTWFTGAGNTRSQASGLAGDVTYAHDLLITTMESTSGYDRGITFAVDNTGAGNSGWRLGKWHSGDARDSSKFVVDGQIFAKAGYTDEYDYYADDYSSYYSSQGGNAHWDGDVNAGWHVPGVVTSSAIQIQSGNAGTNARKPQIQFHQYGYGGPAIEYDGPNKTLMIGELGSSTVNRLSTVNFRMGGGTIYSNISTSYINHTIEMRAPIFKDSDSTSYYGDFGNTGTSIVTAGNIGAKTTSPLQALDVRGNFLLAVDATTATHITQKPYTVNGGTLSWEGSEGQLFSIANNLTTGSIFSVNPISGIPIIDVNADRTIALNPYGGNTGIGLTNPSYKLDVNGTSRFSGASIFSSNISLSRDLYINGGTGGIYGNRLVVGNTDTSFTAQDGNLRPTIQAHGQYPVVSLNHTVTGNTNHGPTLQFTCNGVGNQFVIGTNGSGTFLSMGYSSNGDWNPHNGIAGYNGISFFHANTSGNIGLGAGGDWGALGGGDPGYNLHFVGSNNATGGHAAFFDNRVSAVNGSGFLFRNQYSNHSWGIVAEYRIEGTGGADRPSILFSTGYNSNTWSVGYGSGTDDNFRINYDHGHRNSSWGTTAVLVDRSSIMTVSGEIRAPIFRDSNDPTNYYVDPASTSVLNTISITDGNVELYRSQTIDMSNTGTYSASNYYPVIIPIGTEPVLIQIQNNLNSNAPSWSTHGSGFTLNLRWITNGSGWGTTQVKRKVFQYYESWTNARICGGISQLTNSSTEVVWLRGGGIYYFKYSRVVTAAAQATNYTLYGQTASVTSSVTNEIWDAASGTENYYATNINATNFYGDGSNLTGITAGATLSASSGSQRVVLTSLTSGTMTSAATSSALTFDSSTGTLSSTIFTSTSDITKKTNIQNIKNAVELTKQINGVKFDWKETGESSAGVIAQEVEEVLPEIVHTNDEGIKSVNYNGVVGLLVEAIKEQQKQIDELKKELKKLHK